MRFSKYWSEELASAKRPVRPNPIKQRCAKPCRSISKKSSTPNSKRVALNWIDCAALLKQSEDWLNTRQSRRAEIVGKKVDELLKKYASRCEINIHFLSFKFFVRWQLDKKIKGQKINSPACSRRLNQTANCSQRAKNLLLTGVFRHLTYYEGWPVHGFYPFHTFDRPCS